MLAFLTGLAGAFLIAAIVWDAIETILVPRRIGRKFRLTRWFYIITWRVWRAFACRIRRASRRESILGFYGPISLVLLLFFWATGLIVAFAIIHWATRSPVEVVRDGFGVMLYMSGETFFTLGYGDYTPATSLGRVLSVMESGLGFAFLGTVVGYLPTMYGAFSQREIEISLMDARAGSPPTAAEFLRRTPPVRDAEQCLDQLRQWERWAVQLLETHISYPQLAYYRSQHINQSWLGALTVILDSTAVLLARTGDGTRSQAHLTFAMARHALVDITQIFIPHFRQAPDRMTPDALRRLYASMDEAGLPPVTPAEFEARLSELRLLYEPYAQALADFLLFELPPWAHDQPRRDNWGRGPWDTLLPGTEEALRREEHF